LPRITGEAPWSMAVRIPAAASSSPARYASVTAPASFSAEVFFFQSCAFKALLATMPDLKEANFG
jgi:hypothetical protein